MIVIIDYGLGNLRSIASKLHRLGVNAVVSSECREIARADKLILPGVGHFATGMACLRKSGLIPVLEERVFGAGTPILGICLGMQLMARWSDEGNVGGLSWISATVQRLDANGSLAPLRLPHVGWNTVSVLRETPLLGRSEDGWRFYFTHSYAVNCDCEQDVVGLTEYGRPFVSMVQRGNIFGTQFHPEKSHWQGLALLRRFAEADSI